MSNTALIDEVRAIRHQISEECGNDLHEISRRASKAVSEMDRIYAASKAAITQ